LRFRPARAAGFFVPEDRAMRRPDLVPDCGRCAALCCVATSFDASEDFAFDKAAGVGCSYLTRDCRCAIHDELVERGLRGCAIYDCFGAGPRATRAFAGVADCERERSEAFRVLRVVHELLWLLTQAARLCDDAGVAAKLAREIDALDAIAALPPADLLDVDLRGPARSARAALRRVGDALAKTERSPGHRARNPPSEICDGRRPALRLRVVVE
jgi:hypothetical protein